LQDSIEKYFGRQEKEKILKGSFAHNSPTSGNKSAQFMSPLLRTTATKSGVVISKHKGEDGAGKSAFTSRLQKAAGNTGNPIGLPTRVAG